MVVLKITADELQRDRARKDQILLALRAARLDRVRLMKTLFLVWHRAGEPESGPFAFEPYLYGPCAFDLYRALDSLQNRALVAVQPHAIERWAPYHLTPSGQIAANEAERQQGVNIATRISDVARWAEHQSFKALLAAVYGEAPMFAARSVLRA